MNGASPSNTRNFFSQAIPWGDILSTSLMNPAAAQPSQTAIDMMAQGRPSFDWSPMGALAPLAGFAPQPEYRTAPPDPRLAFWFNAGPYILDDAGNIAHDQAIDFDQWLNGT